MLGYTRYSMYRDQEAVDAVERLCRAYGFTNHAEAYDYAIRLLTLATNEVVNGCQLVAVKGDEATVLNTGIIPNPEKWNSKENT